MNKKPHMFDQIWIMYFLTAVVFYIYFIDGRWKHPLICKKNKFEGLYEWLYSTSISKDYWKSKAFFDLYKKFLKGGVFIW